MGAGASRADADYSVTSLRNGDGEIFKLFSRDTPASGLRRGLFHSTEISFGPKEFPIILENAKWNALARADRKNPFRNLGLSDGLPSIPLKNFRIST
jgi:hypothetical protein